VFNDDIRQLCDRILHPEREPAPSTEKAVIEKTASSPDDLSRLVEAIDESLEAAEAAPVCEGRRGKIAIAKLLAVGDVLANRDR
jgi:hypothetical protein